MKTLLLSTFDISGGAARSAYRLHQGLVNCGTDSKMLVRAKFSQDSSVIGADQKVTQTLSRLKTSVDSLPKILFRGLDKNKRTPYSLHWVPAFNLSKIKELDPDIINIHWIGGGFLKIEAIAQLKKPIVWTLHDMWAFTGGCHYSQGCDRYLKACESCPQMPPRYNLDLSSWVWQRKSEAWAGLTPTIVTPSRWLANCARSSALFQDYRVEVIPYGLDTETYKPFEQTFVRNKLQLPLDKYLILFGASDALINSRKGFNYLRSALEILNHKLRDRCELVIFGASHSDGIDLGIKAHYLGNFNDETALAQVYSAVDVFVAPSLEDNLPNTVMESIACGTPCVAFNIGGMPDMIDHQQNGYLAKPLDAIDLAQGITWVLENSQSQKLRYAAREKVEQEFRLDLQAKRYLSLFAEAKGCLENLEIPGKS
ncbi:glycosyltransferase family 4 protein [Phormidesmis sp. 146-33]